MSLLLYCAAFHELWYLTWRYWVCLRCKFLKNCYNEVFNLNDTLVLFRIVAFFNIYFFSITGRNYFCFTGGFVCFKDQSRVSCLKGQIKAIITFVIVLHHRKYKEAQGNIEFLLLSVSSWMGGNGMGNYRKKSLYESKNPTHKRNCTDRKTLQTIFLACVFFFLSPNILFVTIFVVSYSWAWQRAEQCESVWVYLFTKEWIWIHHILVDFQLFQNWKLFLPFSPPNH